MTFEWFGEKGPSRRRRADSRRARACRPGLEQAEARTMLSIASFFSSIFPNIGNTSATGTKNPTTTAAKTGHAQAKPLSRQQQILQEPTNVAFPPYTISLAAGSASDPAGTGRVFGSRIYASGYAPAYSTVWLAQGKEKYFTLVTHADGSGFYAFQVDLPRGATLLRAFSETSDQNYSKIATALVEVSDPIVAWDAIALRAIRNAGLSDDEASRALAMLHVAQYDAVASIEKPASTFLVHDVRAAKGASTFAAANAAGLGVLQALFPDQSEAFVSASKAAGFNMLDDASTTQGLAVGQKVASEVVASRLDDGSMVLTDQGYALNPSWGQVRPFALTSAGQFRPSGPPSVGSSAFDQALSEVARLGRDTSTARTADQTASARFWDDPAGTSTNPGHWNAIAEDIAIGRRDPLLKSARAFAVLDVGLADAAIATADARAAYASVSTRPVDAIRQADPTFTPLLSPPNDPSSYTSEHAAFGASAAQTLGSAFGKVGRFTSKTGPDSAPTRTFAGLAAASTDEANSRVWGGASFRFDVSAGSTLGRSVGKQALARFPKV